MINECNHILKYLISHHYHLVLVQASDMQKSPKIDVWYILIQPSLPNAYTYMYLIRAIVTVECWPKLMGHWQPLPLVLRVS